MSQFPAPYCDGDFLKYADDSIKDLAIPLGWYNNQHMTRPQNLKTRIFLDGGDPQETQQVIEMLGFLDGQTTNPTLISKNPAAAARLENGEKFTEEEIYQFYQHVVKEISDLIPEGSVSIEVYADKNTTAEEMFQQGKEMYTWIPNAHIKYPTTKTGLTAANLSVAAGMRVNMTLCFSQSQAAAIYAATKGASKGQVFVSPFIGRLDDKGENGMDLIKNILEMYNPGDGHVEVLTASVRSLDHLLACMALGSDIATVPFKVLKEWGEKGLLIPDQNFNYQSELKPIPYQQLNLEQDWQQFDITHELTEIGIEKFAQDWNSLIK